MGRYGICPAINEIMLDSSQISLLTKYTQGTWEYDEIYEHVNIDGDFIAPFQMITHLESIRFGYVRGDFDVSNNRISHLSGMPIRIDGSFICSSNRLESLVGCPAVIGGDLHIGKNPIKGFGGIGKVSGSVFAKDTLIQSLDGLPLGMSGDFNDNSRIISDHYSFKRSDCLSAIAEEKNDIIKMEMLRWITPEKINEEISGDLGIAMIALKKLWRYKGFEGLKETLEIIPGQLEAIELHSDLGEIGF